MASLFSGPMPFANQRRTWRPAARFDADASAQRSPTSVCTPVAANLRRARAAIVPRSCLSCDGRADGRTEGVRVKEGHGRPHCKDTSNAHHSEKGACGARRP